MNHAYNLTIEQELSNKTAFSVAYVGTAGRDLVNWRDLNACPISTDLCDQTRQPYGSTFVDDAGNALYNHILQLNNDGYSNYNSLQTAFKVRDLRGLTGQFNFVWSRTFDTGSANRGGDFLTNYQNPYNVSKNYAPADFDTPWNFNFTLVYAIPGCTLFQSWWETAGKSIPCSARKKDGPSQSMLAATPRIRVCGIRTSTTMAARSIMTTTTLHTGKTPISTRLHFQSPTRDKWATAGRNSVRQPGISQLDIGLFKNFSFDRTIFGEV